MDHVFEDLTQDSSDDEAYQVTTQPETQTPTACSSSSSPGEHAPGAPRLFHGLGQQAAGRSALAVGAGDEHGDVGGGGGAAFQRHQQSEALPAAVPFVASTLRQAHHDSGSAGYRTPVSARSRQDAEHQHRVGMNSTNASGAVRQPLPPTSISMRQQSHRALGGQLADHRAPPAGSTQGQGLKDVLAERLLAMLTADNHERFRLVRVLCAWVCQRRQGAYLRYPSCKKGVRCGCYLPNAVSAPCPLARFCSTVPCRREGNANAPRERFKTAPKT